MSDNHAESHAQVIAAVALLLAAALCASADSLVINDSDNSQLIRFESDGDIVLSRGWIVEHARLHEWTSELDPRDPVAGGAEGVREFIVRGQGGEVVALLDEKRGNLYLRGQAEQVANLQADPNEHELIISAGGVPQAIIDENGNLTYRGNVTEATPSAQRQSLANQYVTLGYDFFDHEDYADIDDAGENICYKFVDTDSYLNPGSFSWADLSCNHGALPNAHDDWQWDETVSKMFQAVRDQHGSRIDVTSAFRCPVKNNAEGSGTNSKHSYGRAFDFQKRDADNNWAPFPDTAAGREALSLANWDVAEDARLAGVDTRRIRLYLASNGPSYSYQQFLDNSWTPEVNFPYSLPGWDPEDPLVVGWDKINNGHCDTGQPPDEGLPLEPR